MKKIKLDIIITLIFLLFGIFFHFKLTSDGNFIFNMDNARDMVDVREMVTLGKMRLIGPTSGIEGVFDGPGWYYLLSLPFILSGGDPYASIIMEVLLWTVGGYFLFLLVRPYGILVNLLTQSLWLSSNFVVLSTMYALNPNPIIFLMPVFIFFVRKYLQQPKLIYSATIFFLSGLFFNFEMAYGVLLPLVIVVILILNKKLKYLLSRHFWIGTLFFVLTLLPQVLFELKHDFFITKAALTYLHLPKGRFNLQLRYGELYSTFHSVIGGTFMNLDILVKYIEPLFIIGSIILFVRRAKLRELYSILISLIVVPFLVYLFIPIHVMLWHLGGVVVAGILLLPILFYETSRVHLLARIPVVLFGIFIFGYSFHNLELDKNFLHPVRSTDPSVYRNEIDAIDYAYQKAGGKGFKLYTYLPSVIDYPYQYLVWWRGIKKYGYLPEDYAYLPNKPDYIGGKKELDKGVGPKYEGLVVLIKEPDRIGQRHLWENSFNQMETVEKTKVGPLEVELKKENGS